MPTAKPQPSHVPPPGWTDLTGLAYPLVTGPYVGRTARVLGPTPTLALDNWYVDYGPSEDPEDGRAGGIVSGADIRAYLESI